MSVNEERMDARAMTPTSDYPDAQPETPAALKMLATSLACQVELGISIEEAHRSEVRAHRNTKMRLSRTDVKLDRLHRDLLDLHALLDTVRKAAAGEAEPTKTGDVLAEVRELWAHAYLLELEVLKAKDLLESAGGSTPDWERSRHEWQESVRELLWPQPELPEADGAEQYEPDGVVHPPVNPTCDKPGHLTSSCQHPKSEEPHGEPHS